MSAGDAGAVGVCPLRVATIEDVPALRALIARSIRALGASDYSSAQIETALDSAFGVDTALIRDGTYFVADAGAGGLVACGGWSRRRTLFGSDGRTDRDESWLDPRTEPAKIRAYFVDPAQARRGYGRAILERSEREARAAGFSTLALMATLPGVPFYERMGFVAGEAITHVLPGGLPIRFVPMSKPMPAYDLYADTARRARRYAAAIDSRPVAPAPAALAALANFDRPMPERASTAESVIAELDELGAPATMASTGGRFFGFVTGGALPVTVAASWLASTWDQNAAMVVTAPVNARLESVAAGWLVDLLGLPAESGCGFVTCATTANFAALAAARHALLARAGWDVEAQGLFGAPSLTVVVGAEVHSSMEKALAMVGFGHARVHKVPVDGQGRMIAAQLPPVDARTIVCVQAGNVNTGAFDPIGEICERARARGAWVHVDGAFGLWAAAVPSLAHLAAGLGAADSWGTDAHKWLNVPYDSGLVFVRDAAALRSAMAAGGAYLKQDEQRVPYQYTPDFSRRARGIEVWAALRQLGRAGLADLIERCCRHARRFAEGLRAAGFQVLNEIVLNQVMVSFGGAERTRAVIRRLQEEGTCWCGSTTWQGHVAMRISVSSWATTEADVERSIEAIVRVAGEVGP